eukprot:gb/GECH01007289.1/.p1 GENE.gb/GECH01007289.1/~~gb/GECH01007289.1/.p1  ORF type:complete len:595 (+),score=113.39 gb/GECH01007289.1/:1-1785(+)
MMSPEVQTMPNLAYSDINLYSSPERFILRDVNGAALEINRNTYHISVHNQGSFAVPNDVRLAETKLKGLMGIIRLLSGPYLVVMTRTVYLGNIRGHAIYRLTGARLIPFNESSSSLTSEQAQDEYQYKQLIDRIIAAKSFYFSYSLDLTSTFQELYTDRPEIRRNSLWKLADESFFWNGHMARDLTAVEADGWIIPIVRGFIEIQRQSMDATLFDFVLLSRQSCKRAGTRYNMRGVDDDGYVANYVETEQIIEIHGDTLSLLQVRGSIPLPWSQYANLKYKPRPTLHENKDKSIGFCEHFDKLRKRYQNITAVSLVNQTGSEGVLSDEYESAVKKYLDQDHVRFVGFDFHKECKNMKYENLELLMDDIRDDIKHYGYFHINEDNNITQTQSGVIRNNCMDCLDRTNVVQSLIARHVLQQQFADLHVPFNPSPAFDSLFKNTWADNADALSFLYSGTGALKTDYTRTGKRSWQGVLNDGWNSATRYYLNNFSDGGYQDAINLFLGIYQVDAAAASPFQIAKTEKKISTAVSVTVAFGILMLLANILLMNPDDVSQRVLFAVLWMGFLFITMRVILYYGNDFVDRPVLTPGPKKIV